MTANTSPHVKSFFDPATWTVSYVMFDTPGGHAAVVDAVLDYDAKSGRTTSSSADKLLDYVREQKLAIDWILETHAHADHLTAAHYIKGKVGGRIAIGAPIMQVQKVFKGIFHLESTFAVDGSQFDHLLRDGETFDVGALTVQAIAVPGHTPACMAFHVGDAVFVGDTLFMPDVGTARCDFPGGDAHALYRSVQRILSLPAQTHLYMCHDYPPQGRDAAWVTTVATQKAKNIHIHEGVTEQEFVQMRQARDVTLAMPNLILPSVQVNIRAGALPPPEANGVSYLKIPLNAL